MRLYLNEDYLYGSLAWNKCFGVNERERERERERGCGDYVGMCVYARRLQMNP